MKQEKIIVIGGGVGPAAGVRLHQLIIENTKTDGTDQSHLEVHHYSCSAKIDDRTLYLLGKKVRPPEEGMLEVMQIAFAAVKMAKKEAVGGIPCNTFHAPKIWNRFIHLLKEKKVKIEMVHMLNETLSLIKKTIPRGKRIGVMSTTGTRKVGLYRQLLGTNGFTVVEVPEELQSELHDSIYNPRWGIKAVSPPTQKARVNFEKYAQMLLKEKVQAIILGCTEIPLVFPESHFQGVPLVDPMLALARALIFRANPQKLKP